MRTPKNLQPTAIATPQSDADSISDSEPETWNASAHAWTERPPADSDKDPLIGTTLNEDYVVERLLGEGGMGRVYQARHTRIAQKRYAIKVLRAEMAGNTEVLQRFQREAEAAACIAHPNVVGVYDVARTPSGLPYLACEYLQGIELADYLEQVGTLNHVTAVHICVEICEALEAAHAQGVIHRDLKPQNIFLVGDFSEGVPLRPHTKVLDFGLSRFQDVAGNTLTRTGVVMGTPSFMAPEQARGERTDNRTDVYGVGAILYTLLTGKLPFAEETPSMTILAVMGRDPPRPRSIDPSISEHLELVVQHAMAKVPGDRYPDITALKNALEPFTAPTPGPAVLAARASRASLDVDSREVSAARPRLVLLLLLTVVLLAAILAMALAGVGILTGWLSFTVGELALLLVAAVGTTLTPTVILVRRMRREVWNNTARVLAALHTLRAPILAGLLGYGSVTLLVRFGDVVLARFAKLPLLGHPNGIAWAGWDVLFPCVALLAAGAVVLRERILASHASSRWRNLLAGPVLTTGALMVGSAVVYGGLVWRAGSTVPVATSSEASGGLALEAAATPSASGQSTRTESTGSTGSGISTPLPTPSAGSETVTPGTSRPSDEELAAAVHGGEKMLLPLSERYPKAPEVLRPLVIAYASRATGLTDAMVVARRLITVAPEQARDSTMKLLIAKAAQTGGHAAEVAFELMTNDMGSAGLDLLYEIMLTRAGLTERVARLLRREELQDRMSPALKIAYDLRRVDSCPGRVPLLERAASLGDERSVNILLPLTQPRKRGCGKWKTQPCPPICAAEAAQYRSAITRISSRLSGAP